MKQECSGDIHQLIGCVLKLLFRLSPTYEDILTRYSMVKAISRGEDRLLRLSLLNIDIGYLKILKNNYLVK